MRKVWAWILALALVMGQVGVLAEEEKAELLYQGIPWLSDAQTVVQTLIGNDVLDGEMFTSIFGDVLPLEHGYGQYLTLNEETLFDFSADGAYSSVLAQFPFSSVLSLFKSKIAGYEVFSLVPTFACKGEETMLINVFITLDSANNPEAFADLQNKLTSLYGEGEHWTTAYSTLQFDYALWRGGNETAIGLYMMQQSGECSLVLTYGLLNPENILEECRQTPTVDPSDISGL